ncbi:MAG: hypothetical protein M5R36_02230 [Deltaproteobacteria bacterium]|nr:hypothetical protein [Deltaproteobacteria bacterium]
MQTRVPRFWTVAVAFVFVLVMTNAAFAQSVFDDPQFIDGEPLYVKNIDYFLPPSDGSGLIMTWGSEPIGHLGVHAGAMGEFTNRPLEYNDPDGKAHTVIYNQTTVVGMFGFGLWDALNFSGAFTEAINRSFNKTFLEKYDWAEEASVDARLAMKYMLTNRRTDGIGSAFVLEVSMPTGATESFVSDEQMTFMPRVVFDFGNEFLTYALNLGYKYYPDGVDPGVFGDRIGQRIFDQHRRHAAHAVGIGTGGRFRGQDVRVAGRVVRHVLGILRRRAEHVGREQPDPHHARRVGRPVRRRRDAHQPVLRRIQLLLPRVGTAVVPP